MALSFKELKLQLDEAAGAMQTQHGDCGSSATSAMSTDICAPATEQISREGSFHSNASSGHGVFVVNAGSSQESSQCVSPAIPTQVGDCAAPDEPLEISLKIHDSAGKPQILKFAFDLISDSCESVAREMVMDLQISETAVSRIAAKIEQHVRTEQAKRTHKQLLACASHTLTSPQQAAGPRVKRTSMDLVSAQHHALADRHMQRMRSLLTKCRRGGSAQDLLSANNAVELGHGKVKLCKLRGIYVPDVVKAKNCFSHHFPAPATGFETASHRLLQSSKSIS